MNLEDKIKELIEEQGLYYQEKSRTIYTTCPSCGRSDKLSIIKENGSTICYHGSCEFGKAWFQDWLAQTAGISIKQAREKIYGVGLKYEEKLKLKLFSDKKAEDVINPIDWPVGGFLSVSHPEAVEGALYLSKRGVSADLASRYDIRYSPWSRRVILPIKIGGDVYGWQGRAIDNVDYADRMRNNVGFRKDALLMFHDNLYLHRSALLFEGPFDALKFDSFGGIVCSMGKNLSDKQIELINSSPVEQVYLGLDPDAFEELHDLTGRIQKRIKILTIPESCNLRCESLGKKPDFGECNPTEIKEAFENAKSFADGHIFVHLKKFF